MIRPASCLSPDKKASLSLVEAAEIPDYAELTKGLVVSGLRLWDAPTSDVRTTARTRSYSAFSARSEDQAAFHQNAGLKDSQDEETATTLACKLLELDSTHHGHAMEQSNSSCRFENMVNCCPVFTKPHSIA